MGVTVAHDYGMTEVPMICVASPRDTDEQLANSDGKPIPGNEARIVDGSAVLPTGAEGEIQVRGAAVCHLRAKGLMPQKLPEQVEIVSELPRTGLGKVAKLALRDKFSAS